MQILKKYQALLLFFLATWLVILNSKMFFNYLSVDLLNPSIQEIEKKSNSWDLLIDEKQTTKTWSAFEILNYVWIWKENFNIILTKPAKITIPWTWGSPYIWINEKNWTKIKNKCMTINVNLENWSWLNFPEECYFYSWENTMIWTFSLADYANIISKKDNIFIKSVSDIESLIITSHFDKDWDWIHDKDELTTDKNKWDSDLDWWSDWEELELWTNPLDKLSKPEDSDWNYLSDLFEKKLNWLCYKIFKTWINDDCDNDKLTNRQEQQYWTHPGKYDSINDSDWDSISDLLEVLSWLNPNNLKDAQADYDWDWISNIDEIITPLVTIKIWSSDNKPYKKNNLIFAQRLWSNIDDIENEINSILKSSKHISINQSIINMSTNIFLKDTDFDWLSDLEERSSKLPSDPNNNDMDWDWILDWFDTDPLNANIVWEELHDNDNDWLPDYFEEKISIWNNTNWKLYLSSLFWRKELDITYDLKYLSDKTMKDSNNDWDTDWEEDFDGDWLSNFEEFIYRTNPNNFDTDWDGISDWSELLAKLNPHKNDSLLDTDWDLISNKEEILWFSLEIILFDKWECSNSSWKIKPITWAYTDPNNADTDWDWIKDWNERFLKLDPNNQDTDWDWVVDWIELRNKTNPNCFETKINESLSLSKDTDSDWLYDDTENKFNTNQDYYLDINKIDSDGNWTLDWKEDFDLDWITNLTEQTLWTSIIESDTDKDWFSDYDEWKKWSNPLDPYSKPLINNWWLLKLFIEKYWNLKIIEERVFDIPFAMQDPDWDWLVNIEEQKLWTNPWDNDTDWDTQLDWNDPDPISCTKKYICKNNDIDWDEISDKDEINWWESSNWVRYYSNYLIKDTDWDNLSDWFEKSIGSNAMNPDTNWNWYMDWLEIIISKIRWIAPSVNLNIKDENNDWIADEWQEHYKK